MEAANLTYHNHQKEPKGPNYNGVFFTPVIQAKLSINEPGDHYEQEADAMADKVMRMTDTSVNQNVFFKPLTNIVQPKRQRHEEDEKKIHGKGPTTETQDYSAINQDTFFKPVTNHVQRKCHACEEEEQHLHRKESDTAEVHGSNELDNYVNSLNSSGQPMPESSRQFFEPRFGRDFSNVRLHTDSVAAKSAQSINALAYTSGNNIVFNSGQYSPGSASGKRLMAHELTHVIQQGKSIGPKLIQKLDCSIAHIDSECSAAAASCHTADGYCASHYPNPADITTLYNKTAQSARDKGTSHPLASKNLLHYLDNTGSLMVMPSASFAAEPATKEKLKNEHRKKFIDGATARLNDGRLAAGGTADMVWTGTANAFSAMDDMAIAVGGYTLCSNVTVQATALGSGGFKISFNKWTVQGFDCYNWDPGKGIGVIGSSDNDLCCLENNNKAKHFKIQTDPWENKEPECLKDETVTATPPAPSSPAPPPGAPPSKPDEPSKWEKFKKWVGDLF